MYSCYFKASLILKNNFIYIKLSKIFIQHVLYVGYWAWFLLHGTEASWKHFKQWWMKADRFWSDIGISQFLLDLSQFHFSRLWRTGDVPFELDSHKSGSDRSQSRSTVWGDSLKARTEELDGSTQTS